MLQVSSMSHRLWRCLPHKTCSEERQIPSRCVMKIAPILAPISYKGERAPPPQNKQKKKKNLGSIVPLCYRNSNPVTGKSRWALIKTLGGRCVCDEGPEPPRGQPQRSHAQIPVRPWFQITSEPLQKLFITHLYPDKQLSGTLKRVFVQWLE